MANILRIGVENPNELRDPGIYGTGALIRVQSSPTETGSYADISGTGSTPTIAIVALQRAYRANDPGGTSSTWYRTRYEDAGATRTSDWSSPFQVGVEESSNALCSLYDVKQALDDTADDPQGDETLMELILEVSDAIQGYTGRQFTPDPASGTKTKTLNGFTEAQGGLVSADYQSIWIPEGIRTLTLLETATITGGAFTSVAADGAYLVNFGDRGFPYTKIVLSDVSGLSFYRGFNTIRVTGAFGWAAVPPVIAGIAVRAVVRRSLGKGSGGASVAIGPSGREFLLPDMSGADRAALDRYVA